MAEPRRPEAKGIVKKGRQKEHEKKEHPVAQEPPVFFTGQFSYFFGEGDLVEKILNPPEGAEKAAGQAPRKGAQHREKPKYVQSRPILPTGGKGLQGANGARAQSTGAGIAVKPRVAKDLQRPRVDLPFSEAQ